MPYTITDMTAAHIEQVHALYTANFSERWSKKSLTEELNNDQAITLVALDGEHVTAFLNARHVLDEGDINNIAVEPACRQRGLGTLLMQALFARARQAHIRSYTLEVRVSNQTAVAFYERLGFQQVGRRKQYYTNPAEDALLYRIELDAAHSASP